MKLTPRSAAEVLLKRRQLRQSMPAWARLCGFEPAAHHLLLIEKLAAVSRGDITRLIITMPPGSAKSTYASILFPCFFLSQHPKANIIAASHTTELAERFGRKVRNIIAEHGKALGLELSSDSQAAGRWSLKSSGEYFAAGCGVGIAGFRADLAVIDDPIRSSEDASSELLRNRLYEWWGSDLSTRMKPGGRQVIISTRWHEDDLVGRLLEAQAHGGDQWHLLNLPAEAEDDDPLGRKPGEFLWDTEYGYGLGLRNAKQVQSARNWSSLYQQRPTPETGDYFKHEWLRSIDILPDRKTLHIYGASDFAVTQNGGDYTVHAVLGFDPENRLYLLDLWRGRTASDEWVERFCDLVGQWKPIGWAFETGQITSGVGPYLERRMRERNTMVYTEKFPTRGDKSVRAQSIRGRMALQGLYIPNAPWRNDLISELLHFPAGKHDDMVDALGLAGQLLDRMTPGQVPFDKRKAAEDRRQRLIRSLREPLRLPGPPRDSTGVKIKI